MMFQPALAGFSNRQQVPLGTCIGFTPPGADGEEFRNDGEGYLARGFGSDIQAYRRMEMGKTLRGGYVFLKHPLFDDADLAPGANHSHVGILTVDNMRQHLPVVAVPACDDYPEGIRPAGQCLRHAAHIVAEDGFGLRKAGSMRVVHAIIHGNDVEPDACGKVHKFRADMPAAHDDQGRVGAYPLDKNPFVLLLRDDGTRRWRGGNGKGQGGVASPLPGQQAGIPDMFGVGRVEDRCNGGALPGLAESEGFGKRGSHAFGMRAHQEGGAPPADKAIVPAEVIIEA
jgi:hypothetical protein